jgi:hypothetical protein
MSSTTKSLQKSNKLKGFYNHIAHAEIVLVCFVSHMLKSTLEREIGNTT